MNALRYSSFFALLFAALTFANPAYSASLSTGANLGIPGFDGIGDGEFSGSSPVSASRYEHNGSLESEEFESETGVILEAGTYFADVDGHSDLGAGTLESNGLLSSLAGAPPLNGLDGGVIFGGSYFSDLLSFTSTSTDDYTVTIMMNVTGNLDLNGADVFTSAGLTLGDQSDDSQYENDGAINDMLTVSVTLNGNATLVIDAYLDYSADFYLGDGENTDIDLFASLQLILPDGVSFDSQSEHFLASPVPVPAALPLFAFAIGAMGALSRKRTS